MGRIKFFSKSDNEKTVKAEDMKKEEISEAENEEQIEEIPEPEAEINDIHVSDEEGEPEEMPEAHSDELYDELVVLQDKLADLQDKYLRLAAEYDNYRKRTLREKADLIQTAGETILNNILPVVDDFERGLELAKNADDMDAMKTGIELIYNKLKEFLSNNGIKEIDAMNEPFDMDWHYAVTKIPASSDDLKGIIIDVVQKGYTLNNKVIRYPKVVVGE